MAALDYELGYLLEPAARAGVPAATGDEPPLARFWRFARCQALDATAAQAWLAAELAGLDADARRAGVGGLTPGLDQAGYEAAVRRIQAYIAAGDCYQVNFTFPQRFTWFGHPLALYAGLREQQPVRYGGIVAAGGGAIVSLSPELFLERRGTRLTTRPMKGTAPRDAAAETLLHSEKDRAENLMIVDLLRNDLGRVAAPGGVRVDSLFEIEDYPTVRQMVSQVSAEVGDRPVGEILAALFPCGSITGAPKIRAMQIAGQLEGRPRGLYTGALGWIAPGGDLRLSVAIRTLELAADRSGIMGVGSGVVADSSPPAEWRECALKAAFLADLDPGLQLIETLRCEDGVYPRLDRHLARLETSAAWFGFAFDRAAIGAALAGAGQGGSRRVRLSLDKGGRVEVTSTPLDSPAAGERLARWAVERIDANDPRRRHKTTARGAYDRALAGIADDPRCFDVVFLNHRGEVAEGARSNVFVERDGVLVTPPVASGALPGVLRAELLAAGLAREAQLLPVDLEAGFFLGNALRGLIPVRLAQ